MIGNTNCRVFSKVIYYVSLLSLLFLNVYEMYFYD